MTNAGSAEEQPSIPRLPANVIADLRRIYDYPLSGNILELQGEHALIKLAWKMGRMSVVEDLESAAHGSP